MTVPAASRGREKHLVLVVSGGRTGTTFLGDLLDSVIDDAFSVHEPDVYVGLDRKSWDRVRRFGFVHMILGRIAGRTGIRNLTRRYLTGSMDLEELARRIRAHREDYYESLDADLIIESNYQWYGILPGVARVFPSYHVVALVRDPRSWVESYLAQGERRGPRDRVERFGRGRVSPRLVGDHEFSARWDEMSDFERLCWDWRHIYGHLHDWVESDPNSRLYRFEDLFLSPGRESTFREMLDFITRFSDRTFRYDFDPSILDIRKNRSRSASPDAVAEQWKAWPAQRARQLDEICGDLMRELGYGDEPSWRDKVSSA